MAPTIGHKTFGTDSGLRVTWCTAIKGIIAILGGFFGSIGGFIFARWGGGMLGTGRWVVIIWDLDTFFMFSSFLSS